MAMEKDTSDMSKRTSPLRILTTTCLFDGHDAAINIVRRLLQARGAEVIHLGINRSVQEVVVAALQENVDAIAISSYQGGHNQYLLYLLDYLKEQGAKLAIFVGGGATITSAEARSLEQAGVTRVYTSADKLNLDSMITDLIQRLTAVRQPLQEISWPEYDAVQSVPVSDLRLGQWLSSIENDLPYDSPNKQPSKPSHKPLRKPQKVVMGITGTGGAGKSTFIDELLQALLALYPHIRIAYLAVDPSWKKTGGALLGDRIRINALPDPRLYMRSMATRQANVSLSQSLQTCIPVLINQGFDLILIESAGIGQNDSSIVDLVDYSIYLMTKDYGSSCQLEKIEMLQFADAVILNKADQQGSEDAFSDIQRQWHFHHPSELDAPIFPIVANHYQDHGFNSFVAYLTTQLPFAAAAKQQAYYQQTRMRYPQYDWAITESRLQLANPDYLTTICRQQQQLSAEHVQQIDLVNKIQNCYQMLADFNDPCLPLPLESYKQADNLTALKDSSKDSSDETILQALRQRYDQQLAQLASPLKLALHDWFNQASDLDEEPADQEYGEHEDHFVSLSGTCIPHVTRPDEKHWDQIAKYMLDENAPGNYPFTAGVYPTRHTAEDPTRMFAGEGTPEDTNRRFHYLIRGQKSIRLSTAFDPNSLYGHDPGISPDVFACIGMSGVSIATLDDMKLLYSGIDLCDPATSVSMTINGPAAIFMAWFLHTAIDQQVELYLTKTRSWEAANAKIEIYLSERGIGDRDIGAGQRPVYRQELPTGHNGLGLALLGMSGEMLMVDMLNLAEEYQQLKQTTYSKVRGTLQADILKEEIAQNECIFSLDFSLKLMADMQAYFTDHAIAKFYPVSVSGYHIGEAGANPVTQLAFTLANGFTLLEYFLAQGLAINDVAPRLSFFFSNGMDPEYAVIGRVARRIWARTLRQVYKANTHSQKLKYHIQTSGRSLQSQEIDLNDIRTSLQALYAVCDNCNSLHTNAFDETITTPTEDSVYRALSIQSIINREFGLNKNHNPLQGSYLIRQLTEGVEKAVYQEFARLARRGGVLGAIETGYQRNQIQQQSLYYESLKSSQKLDVIGVNCMSRKSDESIKNNLVRCSDDKKQQQIDGVLHFQYLHRHESKSALIAMQAGFGGVENSFQQLMTVAPLASLSELTQVLYQVGGKYRRNM
jgi:methylmalonyl-CoA mutase